MPLLEEFENQGNWLFTHRGKLPILILVVGLLLYVQAVLSGQIQNTPFTQSYEFLCLGVSLLGLLVRIYTVGHTPKNTSGRNTAEQVADTLNTSGIYSAVRHPLYLGNYLMWLGPAMLTQNTWFVIAFTFIYWVYYERIMFREEQFLRGKFGKTYVDWGSLTPAFIPSFKRWNSANLDFSIKKILKNEKDGFILTFVVFFLFKVVANSVKNGAFILEKDTWFYIMAVALVIYLILVVLKKFTTLLVEEGR